MFTLRVCLWVDVWFVVGTVSLSFASTCGLFAFIVYYLGRSGYGCPPLL